MAPCTIIQLKTSNMKTALVLIFLALLVAVYADCDPDGNGMPDCTGPSTQKFRNFWDPTHYWQCETTGAVLIACDSGTGYDEKSGSCIPWNSWQWYAPCADVTA